MDQFKEFYGVSNDEKDLWLIIITFLDYELYILI